MRGLRRSSTFLLFLFSLSLACFSEGFSLEGQTDLQLLIRLEENNREQGNLLSELESSTKGLETSLERAEKRLQEQEGSLERLETSLLELRMPVEEQAGLLQDAQSSIEKAQQSFQSLYQEQEKEIGRLKGWNIALIVLVGIAGAAAATALIAR